MINNGKAVINNAFGGLSISIPSKKNWFALIIGTIWLGGWLFGFVGISPSISPPEDGTGVNMFLMIWLIGWTIGGLVVLSIVLWGFFGIEKFSVSKGLVSFDKTVFGMGVKKKMDANQIKNIRVDSSVGNVMFGQRLAFWGIGPGKIKFDYGYKTHSFGLGVDEAEAEHIAEIMKTHLNG